jgi:hypothetical protein
MPITFSCDCGKAFTVADGFAGKRTRCPACGAGLVVPQPAGVADEDAAFRMLAEAPEPDRPARSAPWAGGPMAPAPRPVIPVRPPAPPPPPAAKPKARRSRGEGGSRGLPRISLSPAVAGGLFGMLFAAVWFFVGLSYNRIFVYAPILFVLSLIAVVRGILGRPED